MNHPKSLALAAAAALVLLAGCTPRAPDTPQGRMTFFVTSANPGQGANLGGVSGADQYCQKLASAVGGGKRDWRAYLSTSGGDARDRIGSGPWQNVQGVVIARNVDELHGNNNLTKQTALTEKGEIVSGRGDPVNMHDVLTGSSPEGRRVASPYDTTCVDWSSGTTGSAIVGHIDRIGLRDDAASKSWNSSHASRACDMESLKATGGAGLLYCFAAN
jgi:hypothetical protein